MITRLAATLVLFSLMTPVASADVVERVVATVNSEAIFLSDLRKRAVPFLPQIAEAGSDEERAARLRELYDQLLNLLIEEQLLKQVAAESGITVTAADVDMAVESIRQQNNMSKAEFREAVTSQGLTWPQYQSDLRKQLIRFKVVNERVRSRVNITEQEVQRQYEQRARGEGSELRFKVWHIIVPLDPDPTATQTAAAREEAEAIRADLTADNFEQMADEFGGGDLGWLAESELPGDLGAALLPLGAGEISQPIRTSSGFHLFFVEDRQVGTDFPSYEEMKEELFREMLDSAMTRQERVFIEELRRDAVIDRML